jgi:hypothetical protein
MSEERIKEEAKIAWANFTNMTIENDSEEKVFLELFRMGLKFQDRSTRHACAEAVLGLANEEFPDICDVSKAHNACMNVNVIDNW